MREFFFTGMSKAALATYNALNKANALNNRPSIQGVSTAIQNAVKAASQNSTIQQYLTRQELAVQRALHTTQYLGGEIDYSGDYSHVLRGAFDQSSGLRKFYKSMKEDTSAFEGVLDLQPKTSQDFTGFNFQMPKEAAHTYSDNEMRKLHEMVALWSKTGLNVNMMLDNFNRFYQIYPDSELTGNLKSYVFITRPEMNIFSGRSSKLVAENANDPMIGVYARMNPEILHMLTSEYSSDHDFIPYLQGRTVSLQEVDYQIKTSDFTVPFFSYKYTYPTVTNESRTGGSIDVTFREDDQMRIMKLFQFWVYYMDAVNKDKLKVSSEHKKRNAFDYMCSIYHIICDPTSEWVLFWSKYTGCYPTSVPISNLSFSLGDRIDNKVSITFNYMRAETLDPAILNDFMGNVHTKATNFLNLHDDQFDLTGPSLSSCPVLTMNSDGKKFLLKWLPYISNGVGATAATSLESFMPSTQTTIYNKVMETAKTAMNVLTSEFGKIKTASASPVIQPTAANGWPLAAPPAQLRAEQGKIPGLIQNPSYTGIYSGQLPQGQWALAAPPTGYQ